ncbi:unnamed protein product [Paramecium octaurelia]|uniref:Uncharacterized protein n=1 Tax=Paramecium octaurelia TaxID=43137 RepID=A0A8S1U5U9_PAROT|nr:unnamed protein product [Paramecium octaurelia]
MFVNLEQRELLLQSKFIRNILSLIGREEQKKIINLNQMKQTNWAKLIEELGESAIEELNEELLMSVVKLPGQKMSFPELQHYLSNEFWVHFDENTTRSKLHDKDKYLLIWCVVKLAKKRNIEFNDLIEKGVFKDLSSVLGPPEKFLISRWLSLLKQKLKQLPWKQAEDKIIIDLKNQYPKESWLFIADEFNKKAKSLRYSKQIRERFNNVINPKINKKPFSDKEIKQIMLKAYELKKKWASIAKEMPGRTDNKIKNCYNSIMNKIKKKMLINKADQKQEQKILKYIQQYNTFDPDELVNQIELDIKIQSSIKVEHSNENSNTSNYENYVSSIIPNFSPMLFVQGHIMQSQFQSQFIGYPVYFFTKRDETSQI